jgi:transposase
MKVTTLGIDLAKSVFQLHGVDARGVVMLASSCDANRCCRS